MKLDVRFSENDQSLDLGFGEFLVVSGGGCMVEVAERLPEASKRLRGKLLIVPAGDTDNLYICMYVKGKYAWVEFGTFGGEAGDDAGATLGAAKLGVMILA